MDVILYEEFPQFRIVLRCIAETFETDGSVFEIGCLYAAPTDANDWCRYPLTTRERRTVTLLWKDDMHKPTGDSITWLKCHVTVS